MSNLLFDKDPKVKSDFLKLVDKESVVGILRGAVRDYSVIWEGDASKEVPEGTPKSKFRFRVNIVVINKDGTLEPKIIDQGIQMYQAFKTLTQDYNLEETAIRISRSGSGKNDTEYSVHPLPKPPSKATMDALAKLELLSLVDDEPSKVVDEVDDLPPY